MIEGLKRNLSYANVMATLAMFVALGGGAYAVATIGAGDIKRNAIHTRHIKGNAVKPPKLADAAVTGPKLADDAVTSGKIAANAVTGFEVNDGSLRGDEFIFSDEFDLNFPSISAGSCSRQEVQRQPGLTAVSHIVVTPPPAFPDTFTLTGKVEGVDPGTTRMIFVACNVFQGGGSVDPDGSGGSEYAFLRIHDG